MKQREHAGVRWFWTWGPAIAQMAAIFAASSLTAVPDLPGGLSNHTGHFVGYALLGALALRGFSGARWRGVTGASAWRAVAFASLYGITDELHQFFVANRTPDVVDWVADSLGALTGVCLAVGVARLRRRARDRDV